jgi:hypothetical protein
MTVLSRLTECRYERRTGFRSHMDPHYCKHPHRYEQSGKIEAESDPQRTVTTARLKWASPVHDHAIAARRR